MLFSCKEDKKKEQDIIVEKVVEKPQSGPERMARDERSGSATWIGGAEYTYIVTRQADDSLRLVENHGRKYYDNSIILTVHRADGSVFFEKTFTKANFAPALPEQFKDNGVLLGMTFSKVEGSNLRFIVSVGSPDDSYEDFYCVAMNLNNYGATSLSKYEAADALDK